jgi:hypothetical protein
MFLFDFFKALSRLTTAVNTMAEQFEGGSKRLASGRQDDEQPPAIETTATASEAAVRGNGRKVRS